MLLILCQNMVGQRTHLVLVNPDGEASGFHSISNLEHRRPWAVIVADEHVSYKTSNMKQLYCHWASFFSKSD